MISIRPFMVLICLILFEVTAYAQGGPSVSGTVRNAQGIPLMGVSVSAIAGKTDTQTDANGAYKLNVASLTDSLRFSFIGFTMQRIAINGRSTVNITMQDDATGLDEVVVVGYGTQKKGQLTASVDVISGDRLKDRPATSVADLIKGTSPNVNVNMGMRGGEPGSGSSLNIRGVGSLSANSSPLVLVDGVEMDISRVDPETVDNISILKDASASAVYGSKAPFGVILITTKKGKRGEGVSMDYSNNFSLAKPIHLPHFVDSYTWATAYNQANANAGLTPVYSDEQMERIKGYLDGTFEYEYDPNKPIDNIWAGRRNGNANNDWPHILMGNNALSQKHNVNVSGGSEKTQYFLSAGLANQGGTYAFGNDSYKRYNLMSNISTQVTDWFRVNSSIKWASAQVDFPMGETTVGREHTFREMLMFAPMMPYHNINGTVQSPLVRLLQDSGRDKSKTADFMANLGGEIEPIKGWKTAVNYNYNIKNTKASSNPKPVMVELGTGAFGNIGKPTASYTSLYAEQVYKMINAVTSYEKQMDDHYFKVMAGFEQEENLYTNLSATGNSPVVPENPSIITSIGGITAGDNMYDWATRGFFGRVNYNFQEKYLVEVAGRSNGSSNFPKNLRYKFFPSASLGYVVSKEPFFESLSNSINYMKLRASYGSLGNQNIANYLYYSKVPIYNELNWIINASRPQYANAPNLISDDISWETITTLNLGVDLNFLKNRLGVNFDWYNRVTDNMLGPAQELPFPLGTATPQTNNAKLATKGFELVLSWDDRLDNGIGYNIRGTLGDSRTKILEYLNLTGNIDTWYKGKNHGEIWGFETDGIIQTAGEPMADQSKYHAKWGPGDMKYKDLNGDNIINDGTRTLDNHGDLKVIGNRSARYNYGISAGMNWKGIDFNMFWQGVAKRDIYPETTTPLFWGMTNDWASSGLYKGSPALDYWRPADEQNILGPNTDAFLPKPYFTAETVKNRQVQSRYMLNAGYIRLKNVQVGYTFPESITGKVFSKARIYFSGENLLTFTSLPEVYDPETSVSSISAEGGYLTSGVIYPMSRTLSLGINLTLK
ncbi:SusC/RagA family TonB-linked outer membrane protein [Sphingobacterium humi]|uniref:SusC/RagA family TonB-linked outer membrane protein n=1 Tax=Sphingobacterium humi TaxID=1796905 RepID=A0A6N8KUF8_9SPHI|nr:TonB-dependent receptor [Sphingobacterium humi]MVZ60706.1 SusC/RagA family TonB-linked outer membrane protein [Sphingobacterium humi]